MSPRRPRGPGRRWGPAARPPGLGREGRRRRAPPSPRPRAPAPPWRGLRALPGLPARLGRWARRGWAGSSRPTGLLRGRAGCGTPRAHRRGRGWAPATLRSGSPGATGGSGRSPATRTSRCTGSRGVGGSWRGKRACQQSGGLRGLSGAGEEDGAGSWQVHGPLRWDSTAGKASAGTEVPRARPYCQRLGGNRTEHKHPFSAGETPGSSVLKGQSFCSSPRGAGSSSWPCPIWPYQPSTR